MTITPLTAAFFLALATAFAVLAWLWIFSNHRALQKRVAQLPRLEGAPVLHRTAAVEIQSLGSIERAGKVFDTAPSSFTIRKLMEESGLLWTKRAIALRMGVLSAIGTLFMWLFGVPLVIAVVLSTLIAAQLLFFYAKRMRTRRFHAFQTDFVAALDMMIRGLRSGLPLLECFDSVTTEAKEPIRSEFIKMVDAQRLGTPLSVAIENLADRVPLTEVRFFSIIIAIQYHAGGGLAESLENLAETLRGRWELAQKVRIASQEARSSALIVGAIPFLVAGALYFFNPDYLRPLVETGVGLVVLISAGLWMLLGVAIMRRMVNFDV